MLCYSAATVGVNAILPSTLADGITGGVFTATSPFGRAGGLLNCIFQFKGYYVVPISTASKLAS
jgi:hypothetical protein